MNEIKCGQVYVRDISNPPGIPGYKYYTYYFVTGMSPNSDFVNGMAIKVLSALGVVTINEICPDCKFYVRWFEKAKLIDDLMIKNLTITQALSSEEMKIKTSHQDTSELDKLDKPSKQE